MLRRPLVALLCSLCLAIPVAARAHGGLPVSQAIHFQGETMYVPVHFWGLFFGTDGGPWRWICEEAVNARQDRRWALQGDGTWHATDYGGVTSSRDGGCTWVASTGDIAQRQTSFVLADPKNPHRAWATTAQGASGAGTDAGVGSDLNALYFTDDGGLHWTASSLAVDEYLGGVAISADGQRIYVTGRPRSGPNASILHVSRDAGATWSQVSYLYLVGGAAPTHVVPLAVAPLDAETVYLRVEGNPMAMLLRVSSDGKTVTELLRSQDLLTGDGSLLALGIGELWFDDAGHTLMVAAVSGLYRSTDGAALAKLSNLNQSQCVTRHGNKLYACSSDFAPDSAAIARSSDNGTTFAKVFQYGDTLGPIQTCPVDSPVAKICPASWDQYFCTALKGADACDPSSDGAVGMADMGTPRVSQGKSCSVGVVGARGEAGWGLLLGGVLGMILIARRRVGG